MAAAFALACLRAHAQSSRQVAKPPVAQAWIDAAKFSGLPMGGMGPGKGGTQGAAKMGATLGAMMGESKQRAEFGFTQVGTAGRWMDVTLYTSRNPGLAEALQNVPEEWNYEPPKGKLVRYWGCSEPVRPGQPKIVDLQTATLGELSKLFEPRPATQRGTHGAAGRPAWPNKVDYRIKNPLP